MHHNTKAYTSTKTHHCTHLYSDMASIFDAGTAFHRLLTNDDLRRHGHEVAAESFWNKWEGARHAQVTLDHLQLIVLAQFQQQP